jgi:hypothetical protein
VESSRQTIDNLTADSSGTSNVITFIEEQHRSNLFEYEMLTSIADSVYYTLLLMFAFILALFVTNWVQDRRNAKII